VAGRIREEGGAIEKENSLVGTVDIINGQDSQVPVVTEVTQGNASAGLEVVVGDGLLGDIEGNGHREEVAIGKTDVFADTAPVLLVHEALKRRETTVHNQLKIAQLTLVKNDSRQSLGLSRELVVARGIAGEEVLEDTTVRRVGHCVCDRGMKE
jgi:hypothetical protein